MPHPMQEMFLDKHRTIRFRENAIVRYLLDNGQCNMNTLAAIPFSNEDREQFAQLIGYSVSGFAELSYASDITVGKAVEVASKLQRGS